MAFAAQILSPRTFPQSRIFRTRPLAITAGAAGRSSDRGRWVSPSDPVVRENVCRVVLRIGQQRRESLRQQMASSPAA